MSRLFDFCNFDVSSVIAQLERDALDGHVKHLLFSEFLDGRRAVIRQAAGFDDAKAESLKLHFLRLLLHGRQQLEQVGGPGK